MSVWPFGRRKGRRSPSSVAGLAPAGGSRPASRGASSPAAAKPLGPARRPSTRSKRRRGKRRASPESDCASRSREKERVPVAPSRIDTDPERTCATATDEPDNITALPVTNPLGASPHLRPANRDHADMLYDFAPTPQIHSASHTSLPTARERGKLQKKRPNNDPVPRRKSTKRRRDDHAREEEIRAMSTPVPVKRPAPNSGSIMRRISKKRRSARDQSDLSLPMGDSVHSSMSGGLSELLSASFKVNPLDIFAPRPTIRHSGGSGNFYNFPVDRSTNNSRADSSMRPSPISKDALKENKFIDELADDMDSGTLRELMERDQRRQERKRKLDEEKLRQKLERRAEKQRENERRRERHAAEKADAILDDALGIGYQPTAPAEQPVASGSGAGAESSREHAREDDGSSHKVHASDPVPSKGKPDEPALKSPAADSGFDGGRPSRFSENMSPPLSPSPAHQHRREHSYVSELPELSYEHTYSAAEPSSVSRSSSTSRRKSGEGRRGWTSFFRRRPSALRKKSADQVSPTVPSDVSFSNTSRESMGKHAFPPVTSQPQLARKPSGTPVRTQSKFREDLPERFDKKLPLSPPDSRVQSPDFASGGAGVRGFSETPDIFDSPVPPTSAGADNDKTRTDSPVSMPGRTSALMSTSLASVDSEGSWLSGRPVRHSKGMRSSYGSGHGLGSSRKPREEQRMSYEDLGIPDDEYFRRLTPGPDERSRSRQQDGNKASSFALAEDAEAGADAREGSPAEHFHQDSLQRRPTVVHQQRHKSQEGLLGFLADQASTPDVLSNADDGADEMEGVEPTTPVFEDARETASLDESPEIHRASSIKIPKNQARLSNGSARLVDVKSSRNSSSDSPSTSNL
ncbi:hypothetical protein HDK64DRAFT_93342 [Phyllosticta capitalensis]